jgi:hypothetical protein
VCTAVCHSNALLLRIVEDLSFVFSDEVDHSWVPEDVEESRKAILEEFITERDAFVYENEAILLEALGQPCP